VENTWFLAATWIGLALIATLLAIWFKISTALTEIVVGTLAQLVLSLLIGPTALGGSVPWITFLAGAGSIILTFLAGSELDPKIFKTKWKEAAVVGLAGFFAPFLGCAAIARFVLGWDIGPSWLAGVALSLSTTSVAVVYAVMLELGFNVTEYGKAILAACFVNDLGTVLALGLIFSPFTLKTVAFVVASAVALIALPKLTPWVFRRYGARVSEFEAKFILLALFFLGGLAIWAGSEAVLPAYVIGMVQLNGLTLHVEAEYGEAFDTIMRAVDEGRFDLLIVGQQGRVLFVDWFKGNTTASIVQHAPCSVLIAKW
jgi:glutathione-regulated potassium-efflux system ancillary protein KefC